MKTMTIATKPSYNLHIGSGLLSSALLIDACQSLPKKRVIITDDVVAKLYGHNLQNTLESELLIFPHGEKHKTRETKAWLEDQLLMLGCGRDTTILALGGGVVTDLAGFVAATYCRGVPVIYLPTTLLAMVDASIGGKTGVNTPLGKNLVGSFTQPHAIYADIDTLQTQSQEEYLSGMVESIKHGLIADSAFFNFIVDHSVEIEQRNPQLLQQLIYTSANIKRQIIEQDCTDKNQRALCNFGHTIGHALEIATQYRLSHGQAVAKGMIAAAFISWKMGLAESSLWQDIASLLKKLQINVDVTERISLDMLSVDKKCKDQKIHFVLLEKIGQPYINGADYTCAVPAKLIEESISFIIE